MKHKQCNYTNNTLKTTIPSYHFNVLSFCNLSFVLLSVLTGHPVQVWWENAATVTWTTSTMWGERSGFCPTHRLDFGAIATERGGVSGIMDAGEVRGYKRRCDANGEGGRCSRLAAESHTSCKKGVLHKQAFTCCGLWPQPTAGHDPLPRADFVSSARTALNRS